MKVKTRFSRSKEVVKERLGNMLEEFLGWT